jgi:hypothetical protein
VDHFRAGIPRGHNPDGLSSGRPCSGCSL